MEGKRIGKEARYLFVLIFLYLVTRLPVILSSSVSVSRNLYRGTLAKELLLGLNLPWWHYLTDAYSLAPLFNGFLTIPFFFLFGETMFALKLVPLVWHLFSLVVWYFVWRSCFSQRQVFFILLLFIFTTPWMIEFLTVNDGTHYEMILWMGVSLLMLRKVVSGRWGVVWGGFFLGMLGGFASALILTYLVTSAIILLYSLLARQKLRFYFLYAIGFLIGFSPMLYYNAFHGSWSGVAKITDFYFWRLDGPTILKTLSLVFMNWETGLGGIFGFWDLGRPWGLILGYSYLFIYLFSLGFLLYRRWGFWKNLSHRFDAEAFGLMYQLLHLFLMVGSNYGWGLHYAVPMVPFIGMTIVSSASALKLFWRRSILGFCILTGIVGVILTIDWKQMGATRHLQGFSYGEMAEVMGYMLGPDYDLFEQKADKLLQGRSADVVKSFYQNLIEDVIPLDVTEDIPKRLHFIHHLSLDLHPLFYRKLGIQFSLLLQSDPNRLEPILSEYGISKTFYPDIYYGFVLGLYRTDYGGGERQIQKGLAICEKAPPLSESGCYEGVGALAGDLDHSKYIAEIPDPYRPPYFLGIGRSLFLSWVESRQEVRDFIDSLHEEERRWFYDGILSEIELLEDPWRQKELEKRLAASLH